ncbi:MAG: LpxD N-terminal domain-containing protein, partial [Planctomycetota bacterium]|nr:LpxD N-terminal domain-containing protein [Planctomycetota bacterium]
MAELAELCGGTVEGDGSRRIVGPAGLDDAGPEHVSFLAQANYAARRAHTGAGAGRVGADGEGPNASVALVRCDDPERAFTKVVLAFAPAVPDLAPGVDASAVVDPSAELDPSARVGPLVTIGAGAVLGADVRVHAGCRLGASARIAADTVLHPGVTVYPHCTVGERCVLHSGVVVGSDGF